MRACMENGKWETTVLDGGYECLVAEVASMVFIVAGS
jgi:hypothetical protein